MLKIPIKASQIANLTDARYFAAMGVNWMGFNFNASDSNFISPTAVHAIKEWVEGPLFVGEFGLQPADSIKEIALGLELDMVQLNMLTDLETIEAIGNIPKIVEIVIEDTLTVEALEAILARLAPAVDCFLLSFEKNKILWQGIGQACKISKEELKRVFQRFKVILDIDLSIDNVEEIMEELNPYGLNVSGGQEEQVGVKSFDDLDDIFDCLLIEE